MDQNSRSLPVSAPTDEQLDGYLAADLPDEEQVMVGHWVDQSPDWRAATAGIRETRARYRKTWNHAHAAWMRLEPTLDTTPVRHTRRSFTFRTAIMGAAACAALGAFAIGVVWNWNDIAGQVSGAGRSDTRSYQTAAGQRSELQLPDGSHVLMGPATLLRYTIDKTTRARTVTLEGQAYFTVIHDPARPFSVQARMTTTRVLGTSFMVRAYPTDGSVHVGVAEGRVALDVDTASVVLHASDLARTEQAGSLAVMHDARIDDVLGWTRGFFTLDDVTLREAAAEVARQYGVVVHITESVVAERRLTAVFRGQSLQGIVQAIAAVADTPYRITRTTVEFGNHP